MITREKIIGIIGTILFCALLLLILLFSYFQIKAQSDDWEGIPVMFGNMENAGGITESPLREIVSAPEQITSLSESSPEPPLITQNEEPSISIAEQREKEDAFRRKQAELEAKKRAEVEAARKKQREEVRKREINQQMLGLFGEGAKNRGNNEGAGTQGSSTGNATQGASSGIGGIGTYSLNGRSLGKGGLVEPGYNVNDYGTVVVSITVDPQGNVIQTQIGRGTNTPNTTLRNEALRAARRTKFNAISSTNNQQGTITYKFNLN